jgi:hypothetical protein
VAMAPSNQVSGRAVTSRKDAQGCCAARFASCAPLAADPGG